MSAVNEIHYITGFASAILLLIVGLLMLSRNSSSRVNQLLFGFFAGYGLFETIDATMAFIASQKSFDTDLINLLLDLELIAVIIGIAFAGLAILVIRYGQSTVLAMNNLALWGLGTIVFAASAVIGNSYRPHDLTVQPGNVHAHFHIEIIRDALGWIGVLGAVIFFTGIIVFVLFQLIRDKDLDSETKSRLKRLLIGFILIIGMVVSLDFIVITQNSIIPGLSALIADNVTHSLFHVFIFLGELLILWSFWTQIAEKEASSA